MDDQGRVRIGICSDVHANLAGLRAVARALEKEGPLDHIIVAGDIVQGGPRPRAVWEFLRASGWTLIRGNEDEIIVADQVVEGDYPERFLPAARAQHEWARAALGPGCLAEIAKLPTQHRVHTPAGDLLVVHSSPRNIRDRAGATHNTADEMAAAYAGTGATAIAFGHYHRNFVRALSFGLLVNVASVGLPLVEPGIAAYTIMTGTSHGWIVEQRHSPYDEQEESDAARATGMPPWVPDVASSDPRDETG